VLLAAFASVVIGEAVLSLQTTEHKRLIAAEAFRLLRSGGHYGIHELAVVPDDLPPDRSTRSIARCHPLFMSALACFPPENGSSCWEMLDPVWSRSVMRRCTCFGRCGSFIVGP